MTVDPATTARRACERLGYRLRSPASEARRDRGPTVVEPTPEATPIVDGDHPVAIEPVRRPDPHRVVATVAGAARRGEAILVVSRAADRILSVLSGPRFVRADDEEGRSLYVGADRVHLAGGGLAAVDGGVLPDRPTFEWHEEPADGRPIGDGEGRPAETADRAAGDHTGDDRTGDARGTEDGDPSGRTGTDRRRLVLTVDDRPAAVLSGVDALACPGPDRSAFPYHYRREDDRLFHVYDSAGRQVGTFDGTSAMRSRGFYPVPAPVVPEHLFADADPAVGGRNWAVLDPETGRLRGPAVDRIVDRS